RFMATVRPDKRVPRYVADRLGLDPMVLETLRPFEHVFSDLARFLGSRPIVAQDAALTWAYLDTEARRAGGGLSELPLIDVNSLGTRVLSLSAKPTLGRVAAQLDINAVRIEAPEEEARVLVLVANRLFTLAEERAMALVAPAQGRAAVLRRRSTAKELPDAPGVYTMRDADQQTVYVGKARKLRSRVGAYIHRPLGATRRLEGLV